MKKFWTLFAVVACLTFVMAVPAFGDNMKSVAMENYSNKGMGNSVPDTGMRSDIDRGVDNTTRALDVNDHSNIRANQYRTTATATDKPFNWSWLGLLGLFGLMGLRSRDRERT
jgi:hypothetical protein